MKKFLIVGLGNKGEKYLNTRHNIGFLIADALAKRNDAALKPSNFGEVAQFKFKARPVILLKPDTYMNLSGHAVLYWMKKENIAIENVMIITDDLNLPFGTLRIRGKGSDGGHNGLKSVQTELNTTKYPRLRFGIGNGFSKGQQIDFVLNDWSSEEQEQLSERLTKSAQAIEKYIFSGLNFAMNEFNGK